MLIFCFLGIAAPSVFNSSLGTTLPLGPRNDFSAFIGHFHMFGNVNSFLIFAFKTRERDIIQHGLRFDTKRKRDRLYISQTHKAFPNRISLDGERQFRERMRDRERERRHIPNAIKHGSVSTQNAIPNTHETTHGFSIVAQTKEKDAHINTQELTCGFLHFCKERCREHSTFSTYRQEMTHGCLLEEGALHIPNDVSTCWKRMGVEP